MTYHNPFDRPDEPNRYANPFENVPAQNDQVPQQLGQGNELEPENYWNHYSEEADHDGVNKSRMLAVLLCFFFGFFGAHNFYVGQKRQAIIQLCVFLAYLITDSGFLSLIFVVWWLVNLVCLATKQRPYSNLS